ncbi:HNH endonuclease [Erythrobacter mangrovi]|uniref:HNH endonuclease n=1 Tax=Erythrobacter mangrovi TaxID=2739433 RepID=A0A7D4CN38_9SPHN|nr:HNH endonuclease [Erythrobacter mangrovi]QKG71768.1 HNH endonuclease [Erythrobacter mangrovi]
MTFGVFMHKDGSIYDDIPEVHYQFPKIYLSRAERLVGDWIIYLESGKVKNSRGYFAVAKIAEIIPDARRTDHFLAMIETGSFLDFSEQVPFRVDGLPIESGLLNEVGKISGRAQAAVRPLSHSDFARIISFGLPDEDFLPRTDEEVVDENRAREHQAPFEIERPIVQSLVSKPFRDRAFRRAVMHAYDGRCAVTGWKLVNGGGRLEAQAAHIRPVEHGGPDSVRNGLALSGTAHWMFDRGLIGFKDNLEIIIHRKVNDREGVEAVLNPTGKLKAPDVEAYRPHPQFLSWHREFHGFDA